MATKNPKFLVELVLQGKTKPVLDKVNLQIAGEQKECSGKLQDRQINKAVAIIFLMLGAHPPLTLFRIKSKKTKSFIPTILNARKNAGDGQTGLLGLKLVVGDAMTNEQCYRFLHLFRAPPKGNGKYLDVNVDELDRITVILDGHEVTDANEIKHYAAIIAKTEGWELADYHFEAIPKSIHKDADKPAKQTPTTLGLQPPVAPQKSLAVLPFVNMSIDHENEFLCDGITEDIIIALSHVKCLRVPARTSAFVFKGRNEDIRHIGQLLNVETVLEGSVRKSGNKLRITAQLVNVNEGVHLWSKRYDREMKDVFDIQDDITRAIVGELQVQLGGGSETQFVRHQTASTAAYELYVKGRVYWNWRGVDLKKALHYFELALLEDPDYALAWSGIADTYFLLGFYDFLPCREALDKARVAAEKAIALDKHSAEAHSALGVVRLFHGWDSAGAEAELERALQLNPGNSLARGWYALCLAGEGRDQEALDQARRGVRDDPLSLFANAHLGWMHIILGQFDKAFVQLRRSLELNPNSAVGRWLLGQAFWFTDKHEAALAEFQRAVDLSARNPMKLSSLGWALAQSGQTARAREIQCELAERTTPAPTRPLFLAVLHAAFGEQDLAFAALEQALAERELWLPLPRAMSGLRLLAEDPRWHKFVRKVEAAKRASSSIVPKLGAGPETAK